MDQRLNDARPTSASAAAADALERATLQYLSWAGDPVATLTEAVQADPDFLLGHTSLAALNSLGGVPGHAPAVAEPLRRAQALAGTATRLEKLHLAAAEAWARDDLTGAAALWEEALLEAPRDVLALRFAHDTYFYLGDAANLRDSPARVLPFWGEDETTTGFILGMYAFGLEESHDYAAGERIGRQAVERNPDDTWAIHAVAHVLEMQGRFVEGTNWLRGLESHWTPAAGLAVHQWWHLALFLLERNRIDEVFNLFDQHIRGTQSLVLLDLVDAAALLWRLELLGHDVGDRWQGVADAWLNHAEDHVLVFNDAHIMMALAGAGRSEAADQLERSLRHYAGAAPGTNHDITAEIGLDVARALRAAREKRYDEAVDLLLPLRYQLARIGGSNAQRDLFAQTLIAAAIGAGRTKLARALAIERKALKPNSPTAETLALRTWAAAEA